MRLSSSAKFSFTAFALLTTLVFTSPAYAQQKHLALLDKYRCDSARGVLVSPSGLRLTNDRIRRLFLDRTFSGRTGALRKRQTSAELHRRQDLCRDEFRVTNSRFARYQTPPLLQYRLDEATGDVLVDSGFPNGAITLTIDPLNVARLDPRPGIRLQNLSGVVRSPSAATKVNNALVASDRMTVLTWITPENSSAGRIFAVASGDSASKINLDLRQETRSLVFSLRVNGSVVRHRAENYFDGTATPVMVAITYDGLALRIFRNGILASTRTLIGAPITFKSLPLSLLNSPNSSSPFNGILFNARLFDVPLTDQELAEWYAAGIGNVEPAGSSDSSSSSLQSSSSSTASTQCSDGIDNDGDGFIDYPADKACTSASDTTEAAIVTGNFVSVPNPYLLNSGISIALQLSGDVQAVHDVVFQTWSNTAGTLQGFSSDTTSPYHYPAAALTTISVGTGQLQAIVRERVNDPNDPNRDVRQLIFVAADTTFQAGTGSSSSSSSLSQQSSSQQSSSQQSSSSQPSSSSSSTMSSSSSSSSSNGNQENVECSDGVDNDGDGLVDYADIGGSQGVAGGCFGHHQQETTRDYGYSIFAPSADTRIIYVSNSSGNDANDGLAPARAKRTLNAGLSLLRNGYPDWVLIKRGDTFTNETVSSWGKSGRSASERMLIGTYGASNVRPRMNTGSSTFFSTQTVAINHIAIAGLHLVADTWTGSGAGVPPGFSWVCSGTNQLFEDNMFERYANHIIAQGYPGRINGLVLNRNFFRDPKRTDNGNTKIYFDNIDGIRLTGNAFVNFRANDSLDSPTGTKMSHGTYLHESCGAVVLENNITYNDRTGFSARPGGRVHNNLSIRTGQSFQVGYDSANRAVSSFIGNVHTESRDHWNGQPLGGNATFSQNLSGTEIAYNIATHATDGTDPNAFVFEGGNGSINFHHNIVYDWKTSYAPHAAWGGATFFVPGSSTSISVHNNDFQNAGAVNALHAFYLGSAPGAWASFANNRYFSAANYPFSTDAGSYTFNSWKSSVEPTAAWSQVSYPDPGRTVGRYNVALGGVNSTEAFLAEALNQRRGYWRHEYTAAAVNDYIRAGFGLTLP